ncbi:MAG: PAS domain-containing protein [Bacteroidales bacterium]|jgi:transcriptional regulator with PAS, ATPase and Fis domain|nr:PAS domain-containing protein [Bacteroidales bacterium]MDD4216969.1 PAS domain-containing protein [Bacteroidales bacterium]MDY0142238.1 PAS domain-containing protein [Bacteroidales bacterium]
MTEEIFKNLPFAVTACDINANIIYMNEKSCSTFLKNGIKSLIGTPLFDCHSEKSAEQIRNLLKTGKTNSYTIEKNGLKKLIYQCPWYKKDKIAGLVEISIVIPFEMNHFIR